MSKTAEAVSSFLTELCTKLRPLGEADIAEMLCLKEAEVTYIYLIDEIYSGILVHVMYIMLLYQTIYLHEHI